MILHSTSVESTRFFLRLMIYQLGVGGNQCLMYVASKKLNITPWITLRTLSSTKDFESPRYNTLDATQSRSIATPSRSGNVVVALGH
jgi:hypothetical protein